MIRQLIATAIVWVLKRLGFWWFPSKDNSFAKGRELLFWEKNPKTDSAKRMVGIEWGLGRKARFCHAYMEFAGEEDYKFALAIPRLFQVWLTIYDAKPFIFWKPDEKLERTFKVRNPDGSERVAHYGRWWQSRYLGIEYSNGRIRLILFSDRMNHMYYKYPRFTWRMREPNFNIKGWFEQLVFGKELHSNVKLSEPISIRIPMPEGNFDAVIQHGRRTWGWQRFRKPTIKDYTSIELEKPPTFAGKGENGYDMDDDAIYATSFNGLLNADEVAGQYRDMVLKERKKYGEPSDYGLVEASQ